MRFFEDIGIGDRRELGRHSFTADDIKRYAVRYDPQLFHVDEAAAARSHFGALIASGWHTAAVCMRLFIETQRQLAAELAARGEPAAKLGPSPGFRNLRWLKPVYAGDTISYAGETIEKRQTESPPGWGLVVFRMRGTNQDGTVVFEFENAVLIERRPE
jgi:acyl dehydratase